MQLAAVTALYDLGPRPDGRGLDRYRAWLDATLRLPMAFTVFLDPALPAPALKPGDRLLRLPLEVFAPFAWRERVGAIIARHPERTDIAYRQPGHGLLMFSKFDMLARAAAEGGAEGLVWLDAGLMRFFAGDPAEARLAPEAVARLAGADLAVAITPRLGAALRHGRLPRELVGSAKRLVSGGDIFVRAERAEAIARAIFAFVEEEWLARGLWDNEQVALGCILAKGLPRTEIVAVSKEYAVLAEALFPGLRRAEFPRPGLAARLFRALHYAREQRL